MAAWGAVQFTIKNCEIFYAEASKNITVKVIVKRQVDTRKPGRYISTKNCHLLKQKKSSQSISMATSVLKHCINRVQVAELIK